MNDLPDFEVLENVSSPFEDDPFEQDPLETEETFAEEQAVQPENTPAPTAVQEQPVQESPVPAAAPAEASAPPISTEVPDAAPKTTEDPQTADARKRAEHEAAEAKRKAEWKAKQAEKQAARQAALEKIRAMNAEQLIQAATEKASQDTEKLTRRNMKECVCEYIQTLCLEDPEFARLTLTPPKNMVRCFQYINRKAWEYVQDELKASGQTPGPGAQGYGCDIPDGLCYGWAEEYFRDPHAKEDEEQEEKFISKPYPGATSSKTKSRTAAKKKPAEKPTPKPAEKKPEETSGQLSLVDLVA